MAVKRTIKASDGSVSDSVSIADTPVGSVSVVVKDGFVVEVSIGGAQGCFAADAQHEARKAALALKRYFSGEREKFSSLRLKPAGSAFEKAVWKEISRIPYGHVTTYGDIARSLGNAGAARAVGSACGKNPIPIIIPCHRVVAKGSIGGYSGGLSIKKALMKIEGLGSALSGKGPFKKNTCARKLSPQRSQRARQRAARSGARSSARI
ncbi:MAG: methylated-DNA--[protein]-cysteine S-methyltransferase [Deltaproteobacteria bacterium]|nr:methylated-DNA--[protein]-cysteine S-methyltransferase [Deltaproteobacteria bacterium]